MKHFCHNCGNEIQEGEVYCNKCGTKVIINEPVNTGNGGSNTPVYQPIINTPAPPVPRTSKSLSFPKIAGIIAIIGVFIIAIIVAVALLFFNDSGKKTPANPPTSNTNSNTSSNTNSNTNSTTKPSSSQPLATWSANLKALASYKEDEKKVYVDYTVALKNEGTGSAANVKVYLNPTQDDANAKYLGIAPKTIVNIDEDIVKFNYGATRDIKTTFFYDNIDKSKVNQTYLQDIANKFIKLSVIVEWEENGKKYTQSLILK
jgi:uncharacterized membrane protein YvbJ